MMTVLSVAYSAAPVLQDSVGGAEQILEIIDSYLVARNIKSVVVACAGSRVAGELVSFPGITNHLDDEALAAAQRHCAMAVRKAIEKHRPDIVHMHGLDFDKTIPPTGVPVLVTLHLPLDWYAEGALNSGRPQTWFNCVSRSQHRGARTSGRLLSPVFNGIRLERASESKAVRVAPSKHNYVLALGRICPEKNFHESMEAAARAGVPMFLAGNVFPYEEHERYFEREIRPRLSRTIRFLGPVAGARKQRLLAGARALLISSRAPETSSLVAMEALAAGTPVIAYPSGALPEVVDHGRTGFLVRSPSEMADAICRIDDISPAECRQEAQCRFSGDRMARQYFQIYQRLALPGRRGLLHARVRQPFV